MRPLAGAMCNSTANVTFGTSQMGLGQWPSIAVPKNRYSVPTSMYLLRRDTACNVACFAVYDDGGNYPRRLSSRRSG